MDTQELRDLTAHALSTAYAERAAKHSDREQLARAWERLADAADSLDAILTRQELYESDMEPGVSAT